MTSILYCDDGQTSLAQSKTSEESQWFKDQLASIIWWREMRKLWLANLTPEELASVPLEKRLAGLALEDRLAGLAPEELADLMQQIESYLQQQKPK